MAARVIISKLATLHDLQTVYGYEDMFNLSEMIAVDIHNQNIMSEPKG